MYAYVEVAGQQFRVEKDKEIHTQKLTGNVGDSVAFDKVVLLADEKNITVGQPTISGATIKGTIVKQYREPKVIVFKKKRRKGYRVRNGHRQSRTAVRIEGIEA